MISKPSPDRNTTPNQSVLTEEITFENFVDEFDHNMKIVDFFIETESFYDLELTLKNLKKINMILSDSSGILANIHAMRYEFTPEYQKKIYDRIEKRFVALESRRKIVTSMTDKCDLLIKQGQGVSVSKGKVNSNDKQINIKVYKNKPNNDLCLNTNLQEKLLNEASSNLIEIGKNISETSKSIKDQGGSIKNMTELVEGTGQNIRTSQIKLKNLSWAQRTQLLFMHSIALMLFITIVILIVLKLIK